MPTYHFIISTQHIIETVGYSRLVVQYGFLRRLHVYKCGFTVRLFTIEQLLCDADNVLFRKSFN